MEKLKTLLNKVREIKIDKDKSSFVKSIIFANLLTLLLCYYISQNFSAFTIGIVLMSVIISYMNVYMKYSESQRKLKHYTKLYNILKDLNGSLTVLTESRQNIIDTLDSIIQNKNVTILSLQQQLESLENLELEAEEDFIPEEEITFEERSIPEEGSTSEGIINQLDILSVPREFYNSIHSFYPEIKENITLQDELKIIKPIIIDKETVEGSDW